MVGAGRPGDEDPLPLALHYTAPKNKVNDWLVAQLRKRGQVPDIFTPDGFVLAQMLVQALQKGDYDVDKMITALEGCKFLAPEGDPGDPATGSRDAAADVPGPAGPKNGQPRRTDPRVPRRRTRPPRRSWRCGASEADALRVSASPILATSDLGLDIGGATIVAGVGLEVREGELLGVIGPNGAGKTTLFNLVSGLLRPTSGRVLLDGVDITDDPPFRRARRRDRAHVPGLERLPAAAGARERAPGGRGGDSAARCGSGGGRSTSARRSNVRTGRSTRVGLAARAPVPGRAAVARRQAQARARDGARGRRAGDPARRADGRCLDGEHARSSSS